MPFCTGKRAQLTFLCFLSLAIVAGCNGNSSSNPSVLPQAGVAPQDVASASPGTTATPGGTPTPAGSPTPTPAPTATPTPRPTAFPTYPGVVKLGPGYTVGVGGQFTPKRGDAWPGSSAGTAGQPVDNITCDKTMTENQFHVHAFVGVLVNGIQYALPDSIGMNGYGPVVNGFVNAAYCFYSVHTHDNSGMIHMEAASTTPNTGSLYTLGNLLDIWDQPLTQNGLASFTGMVQIYYVPRPPINTTYVQGYQAYTGDPYQLPLYSHTAVWIEVGPPYIDAAHLPYVRFYTEY